MGAGTIFLLLVVLVLVAVGTFVYLSGRSKLQREKDEKELPPRGEDERPAQVAVGTPDQLEDLDRKQR